MCFITKYFYGLVGVSSFMAFVKMCMVVPDIAFESLSKTIFIFILFVKVLMCEWKSTVQVTKEFQDEEDKILSAPDDIFKQTYIKEVRFYRNLVIFNTVACVLISGELYLSAWWDAYNIPRKHRFDNETYELPPATYLVYPFDDKKHPLWALTIQTIAIINTCQFTMSVFAFRTILMGHLAAKFRILNLKLKNFGTGQVLTQTELSLKDIITEHQSLIGAVEILNKSLKSQVLLEYTVSSLVLAATVLQILAGRKVIFHILYFLTIYSHLSILCFAGSNFITQSVGLGDALYESGWYNLDRKTKSDVAFMLLRCQKPLTISIGPFGPLEAEAALSRMKIVYSYLTLISGAVLD